MKSLSLAAVALAMSFGAAMAADTLNQKTDPSKVAPQSSHPGVTGHR